MNKIEVQNLFKEYPKFALKSVNFSIPAGYVTGFIGKNGMGDSDIMMTDTINPLKSKFKASTKLLNKTI